MIDMVRTDIGAWLAWAIVVPTALVNVVVNMSQMSAMVEGTYGALGMLPPAERRTPGLVVATIVLTGVTRRRRGARRLQARREDHDGAAARHPRLLHRRRDQGAARLAHVARARPRAGAAGAGADCRSSARDRVRDGFTQIMAIAGQGAGAGGVPVLRLPRRTTPATPSADVAPHVLEDGAEPRRDLGPVLGRRHRRRRHRAARRLHRQRADATSASATTRRSRASRWPARCSGRRCPARSASWRRACSRSACSPRRSPRSSRWR